MDFDLTDEQTMLKDALDRLLKDAYGFEQRRKYMTEPAGYSADMWNAYAEMGLMALPFAEEDGGLAGTPVETMIVMESLGRVLALEPYFATMVLGGGALKAAASSDQKAELIPQIADGSLKLALAHTERNSRYDLNHVETKATKDGDGWLLTGQKSVVLHGEAADKIVVVARAAGDIRDENGIGLFIVDASGEGVTRRGYATQDGSRAAEIRLDNARAEALGDPENGLPALRTVIDSAIAALGAESVGVMSTMHELTVEYLKVRKQFGTPIGAFQVLQHKAVDMYVAIEQARSITLYATMMADSDDTDARAQAMHAAKAEIGRGGRVVGENAIQLHGGVGMAMEYAVGHYFKRMTMIDTQFGDGDFHLRALANGRGLFEAA
ncbi:acyl-CoA dehydrogenase family protein [Aliihoeflea sp. PC F10.4]